MCPLSHLSQIITTILIHDGDMWHKTANGDKNLFSEANNSLESLYTG